MILLAQFILLCSARCAEGSQERLIAQIRTPGLEDPYNMGAPDTKVEPSQNRDDTSPPESPEDLEMPSSLEDLEMPPKEVKPPVSPQEEQPIPLEKEAGQAPDTCSQMLQYPFLENVIELTGFSMDFPNDFQTLPREQAFEVMREILIRRGFSGFAYWDNSQAVRQQWYLNFMYGVLERDGLVEHDTSLDNRLESLELGGYISRIWSQEKCACYEDILNSFNDLIITEILGRNRLKGPKLPFPYYQGTERELLEADLVNVITTASGLGKRMYMSRQGISEENFCHVQRELLLRNGYNEFANFNCIAYVQKNWYTDFLYYVLSKEIDLGDSHDMQLKEVALVKEGFLPPSISYQKNIYEQDMYLVINDPKFLEALNRKEADETVDEDETFFEFPNVYEEPISPVR
jgi:hypothetical protein